MNKADQKKVVLLPFLILLDAVPPTLSAVSNVRLPKLPKRSLPIFLARPVLGFRCLSRVLRLSAGLSLSGAVSFFQGDHLSPMSAGGRQARDGNTGHNHHG
jgi:hypothetical protein